MVHDLDTHCWLQSGLPDAHFLPRPSGIRSSSIFTFWNYVAWQHISTGPAEKYGFLSVWSLLTRRLLFWDIRRWCERTMAVMELVFLDWCHSSLCCVRYSFGYCSLRQIERLSKHIDGLGRCVDHRPRTFVDSLRHHGQLTRYRWLANTLYIHYFLAWVPISLGCLLCGGLGCYTAPTSI